MIHKYCKYYHVASKSNEAPKAISVCQINEKLCMCCVCVCAGVSVCVRACVC